MKPEEWLAEFERVHGRPANQEKFQQLFGQFGSPETQATPNTPVNPIQSPFGGASPTSNQYQGGTSPRIRQVGPLGCFLCQISLMNVRKIGNHFLVEAGLSP